MFLDAEYEQNPDGPSHFFAMLFMAFCKQLVTSSSQCKVSLTKQSIVVSMLFMIINKGISDQFYRAKRVQILITFFRENMATEICRKDVVVVVVGGPQRSHTLFFGSWVRSANPNSHNAHCIPCMSS